jgi:NitT/TauT family transport system substrate-binding protein
MQTANHLPRPSRSGAPLLVAVCLTLLVSVSLAAVMSHADSAAGTAARQPLTILVPQSTASLPFLLMAAEQSVPGAELRVQTFLNHPQALVLLLRGEADLLFTGTSQGWENRQDGSPIVTLTTGVWGVSSLVVTKEAGIAGFSDLKGKRLALPFPGAPLDFQTRAILDSRGIDPGKDLTISYGPFTQSVPLLLSGRLDAAALPEPLATTVVKTKGLLRAAVYAEEWKRVTGEAESPQVSLFATEQWVKGKAALLAALLDAWKAASARVSEGKGDVVARFASTLSTDPAILEESLANTIFSVPDPAANRVKVERYYQQVARFFPGTARKLDDGFFYRP